MNDKKNLACQKQLHHEGMKPVIINRSLVPKSYINIYVRVNNLFYPNGYS